MELAIAIAERITRRLGVVDPQVLLENVRAALKLTARNVPVMRIMIHPSQGATLKAALASLQLEWPQLAAAEIIEDGSILPGGSRVETSQLRQSLGWNQVGSRREQLAELDEHPTRLLQGQSGAASQLLRASRGHLLAAKTE